MGRARGQAQIGTALADGLPHGGITLAMSHDVHGAGAALLKIGGTTPVAVIQHSLMDTAPTVGAQVGEASQHPRSCIVEWVAASQHPHSLIIGGRHDIDVWLYGY